MTGIGIVNIDFLSFLLIIIFSELEILDSFKDFFQIFSSMVVRFLLELVQNQIILFNDFVFW